MFPLKNVAAHVIAFEEDEYLERNLKWLSSRMGRVYLGGCKCTFMGTDKRDVSPVRVVFERLRTQGFTNIVFVDCDFPNNDSPAVNDALFRNQIQAAIQKDGFEWTWIVDSDEMYTEVDVRSFWEYFLKRAGEDRQITGMKCKMWTYWRSLHYKIDPPEPYCQPIIIRSNMGFGISRLPVNMSKMIMASKEVGMMRHYSYARTPKDTYRKITSWSHAPEVVPNWFENVFMRWTPDCGMRNIHPTHPSCYGGVVKCDLPLPEVMKEHLYEGVSMIEDKHKEGGVEVLVPEKSVKMFPLKNVAAHVIAFEEDEYLERTLKWLSSRVGRVYLGGCKCTFMGTDKRDVSPVRVVAARLKAQGFDNIIFVDCKFAGSPNPAINESSFRNQVQAVIRAAGFEWTWIVDSDEAYTEVDVRSFWEYFLKRAGEDRQITGMKCKMWTYWRSLHYKVDPPEPHCQPIIVRSDMDFDMARTSKGDSKMILAPKEVGMLFHYSWVRTPADTYKKITSWGHAHQVIPNWFENVFMKWSPNCGMENVHPTEPSCYKRIVKCDLPMPEVMEGHPYIGKEMVEDVPNKLSGSPRIKVVILNHNKPENADRLFEQLSTVFDDVEIFDSGSDCGKIPINVTRSFSNIYWTGAWNEIMRTCSDYDAVWMLGCDIELRDAPEKYKEAMGKALPFGVWSPCVEGRAHDYMQANHFGHGQPKSVRCIEGMALALSGALMRNVKELVKGSSIGFGQDLWLCYMARQSGMKNIIDGRIKVFHPVGIGYSLEKACGEMESTFSNLYGGDFRNTIFDWKAGYEDNLLGEVIEPVIMPKPLTIVTVDNGWGYPEFVRIVSAFPDSKKIVFVKGVSELVASHNIEIRKYGGSIDALIKEADIAIFPKIGAANKEEYLTLLRAGIPTIAHVDYFQNAFAHEVDGYIYREESWAISWVKRLMNPVVRRSVSEKLIERYKKKEVVTDTKHIQGELSRSPRIKVVILNHNKPENADKLFEQFSTVFDDVEIFDSGSDCGKIPINVTRSFPNIYWTGAWNEIMRTCSDYDAVWMLCCDIELRSGPKEYRKYIEKSLPFGVWSPCVEGRAHEYMQSKNYTHGQPKSVRCIEGMALALSGALMKKVVGLIKDNDIGWGQDAWLCYMSRQSGLKNVIDGRVKVFHPEGIGYDVGDALKKREDAFVGIYGSDYRKSVFEWREDYKDNLLEDSDLSCSSNIPLVSIITPTYKRDAKIVRRCMDCVKLQTIIDWEQLICSDGAEELQIKKLVGTCGDVRVSYHFTQGKVDGDYGNRVRGEMLKRARGKYVLFCDDDNLILPNYLEKMIKAIEEARVDFAVSEILHFGPLNEAEVGKPPMVLRGNPIKLYHVDPLQILVKREVMLDIGWDIEVGYLSDGVTIERLGKKYKHVRVESVLGIHM